MATHVDGVYFWGATRNNAPQWLLAAMSFSGLFESIFIHQVQVSGLDLTGLDWTCWLLTSCCWLARVLISAFSYLLVLLLLVVMPSVPCMSTSLPSHRR